MNIAKAFKLAIKSLSMTLSKHAPEIMVVGGCIGAVGAAVLACKETIKTRDILEEGSEQLDAVPVEDKKARACVRIKTAGKLALNYVPSVALGTASIMSILGGHHILKKRHLITVAALADQADRFDKLKNRIEEKLGIDETRKLITGEHEEKVKETVADPDTGKEKSRNVTKTLLGEDLSGRYHITLDRQNAYDICGDFDINMARAELAESELNKDMSEQAQWSKSGVAVKPAKDIMARLGYKKMDAAWLKEHRNMGCIWTPKFPYGVSLGLSEARRLHDFGIEAAHDELHLSINFVPNIWDYV